MTPDVLPGVSPPEIENLDRIRAILFGAQAQAFSDRLDRIEADVAAREAALRLAFAGELDALRDAVTARADASAADAVAQADALATRIEAARTEAAALVAEARAWGRESDAALRDAFTGYTRRADARALRSETALDALARDTDERQNRLAHAAAERDVLAALFDDAARRLRLAPASALAPIPDIAAAALPALDEAPAAAAHPLDGVESASMDAALDLPPVSLPPLPPLPVAPPPPPVSAR